MESCAIVSRDFLRPDAYLHIDLCPPAITTATTNRYFSLNVPLRDHVNDPLYAQAFTDVFEAVWAAYQPQAVILQAGCDSVYGVSIAAGEDGCAGAHRPRGRGRGRTPHHHYRSCSVVVCGARLSLATRTRFL